MNFKKWWKKRFTKKIDIGILAGVSIGLFLSLSFFHFIFNFSSNVFFALGAPIFWLSLLIRPILEYFNVKGIWNVVAINTLITVTIFGFIGYLLNLLRKHNKSLFKSIISVLIIAYVLLFASCHLMITSDW
ncbi:hypothetical protein J4453_03165 [Candidatus Woesearchaeota archaeon]|nr:hypothetical protein [Candidatus Woesearchaeota archaeon]